MTTVVIDFGTSNTVVCVADPVTRSPRTIKFDSVSRRLDVAGEFVSVVPSLVFVSPNSFVFGEQVRSWRLGFVQSERCFRAFKRDLAADFVPPPQLLDGTSYTALLICELFLTEIWQQIEQQRQCDLVIFTVPVGAFERYQNWFRNLGEKLNIPNAQIVDESTAAALGYAVNRPGAVVLVIDFGGGTLDLSLLTYSPALRHGDSLIVTNEDFWFTEST